nr:MAG TPA: hypothetical protein [Caudoviricetes sp.]
MCSDLAAVKKTGVNSGKRKDLRGESAMKVIVKRYKIRILPGNVRVARLTQ